MKTKTKTTTIAAAILFAVAATTTVVAQSGGGSVDNVAPSITSGLSGDVASTQNTAPVVETYSFTVHDPNGEADLQGVKIDSSDATFGSRECLAPFSGCDAEWSVSGLGDGDGSINFQYAYTWPQGQAAGTYTQSVSVRDEGAYIVGATTDGTVFANAPSIVASSGTFLADGSVDTSAWGDWSAAPGASLVASQNYIRAENSGTAAGDVTVSFSDVSFDSASTGGSIDIDGNILFRVGVGASPSAATFTDTAIDADGSYTTTLQPGDVVWIAYEVQAFPSVLPDATDYAAAFVFG